MKPLNFNENKQIKIGIVTGTRAEYGLLKSLIIKLRDSPLFETNLFVTGSHLSDKHGRTIQEIVKDNIHVDASIDLHIGDDTPSSVCNYISRGIEGFSEIFGNKKYDMLILLGDRYELLAAATAAMIHKIPIGHIHGGEVTVGAYDEGIRHAITKLSHLHFVAADEYRDRVIQLGELPKNVFNVGGLGVDGINETKLIPKETLSKLLDIKFKEKTYLVTFHPVTLDNISSQEHMTELLGALKVQENATIIFTLPNADSDNGPIRRCIEKFVVENKDSYFFASLGQQNYYSCVSVSDAVIGNSSSGILEVPTFRKPTINIGDRQKGRLRAKSVIDCLPVKQDIHNAIKLSQTEIFQRICANSNNPYGEKGAPDKIVKILTNTDYTNLLKKEFYDLRP